MTQVITTVRLLLTALLCVASVSTLAAENITRFVSDITVQTDASLDVTESITVNAEGNRIRRGIYRDFPTTYRDRFNNRVRVDFDVLDVTRNGAPESYTLERLSNGVRVRIGNANVFLQPGPHTYEIRYRTDRQLGFFDDFDELYWNVTGNGWEFPIEYATARVRLPAGANVVQKFAYTGRYGETGSDYEPIAMSDGAGWQTTRTLQPGEGLTVAIAWPKGFVPEPTLRDRWDLFVRDNRANATALLGVVFVFVYYLVVWRRHGKDPASQGIFPRFEPPDNLSPAAVRFIRLMNFDRKAFSAALISMGVKGFLRIKKEGRDFNIERAGELTDLSKLAGGERRIAKHLLMGES
ncbi:MAG: DUF2207 domain-containing protein, partial [Gammaproteobacteria bacterium]|nr:DUF2207 domain-containing protein [Gammaproteobacteria bacterium]